MSKLAERLLIFFLGIPLFIATILLVPHYHYFLFQLEIIFFSTLAVIETRKMLSTKIRVYPAIPMAMAGILTPLAATLACIFSLPTKLILVALAVALILVFIFEFVASFSGRFDASIEMLASGFFVILYPGLLAAFLALMTNWQNASALLCTFFLMVFGCDSCAWLFGVLLGRGNRGVLPASPNKSVAGFIGGYIGSAAGCAIGRLLWPLAFTGATWKLALLSFCVATAAIIGDIAESILKRSASFKDSGAFMPGRGGVMDTIDSVLLSAPVFYFICGALFNV